MTATERIVERAVGRDEPELARVVAHSRGREDEHDGDRCGCDRGGRPARCAELPPADHEDQEKQRYRREDLRAERRAEREDEAEEKRIAKSTGARGSC